MKQSSKIPALDGLRGLAALAVVFNHYLLAFFPGIISRDPDAHYSKLDAILKSSAAGILMNGTFAVSVFFVLSGFVLSNKFFATGEFDAPAAYVKRYFRLTLPVFASILLVYVALKLHLFVNGPVAVITGSAWLGNLYTFTSSLPFALWQGLVGVYLGNVTAFNPVLWTMPVEFYGSLLVFALIVMLTKFPRRWLLYAVLIAVTYDTSVCRFVLGMALADLWHSPYRAWLRAAVARGTWVLILATVIVLAGAIGPDQVPQWLRLAWLPLSVNMMLLHDVGSVLLVILALAAGPVVAGLSLRPVRFLGRISFSLYLLHVIVLTTFSSYVFLQLHHHLSGAVSVEVMMAVSIPVLLGASALFAWAVDEPAVNYAGHFYRWMAGEERLGLRGRIALPAWLGGVNGRSVSISSTVALLWFKERTRQEADAEAH